MKIRNSIFIAGFAFAATLSVVAVVTTAPAYAQASASSTLQDQAFFKKKYRIKGTWSLVERDGVNYVKFSDISFAKISHGCKR